jgi:MFS family permease
MSPSGQDPVSLRVECAVYGVGAFCTTMHFMSVTIVPLWVVAMGLSPFWLGVVLGSRSVLALFLSIHTGVLMDRIGGRRVMLFMAILGTVTPILYPIFPYVWAAIVLQLLWGFADSMGWMGAQTLVGKLMQGRTRYAGRLSVTNRMGNIIGPPIAGIAWDTLGPWGAFGACAIWGLGAIASAWLLPKMPAEATSDPGEDRGSAIPSRGLRGLLPDPADYVAAFRLLAIPMVAITATVGMMVHVGNNIQSTFYVVWLNQVGIPGTLIGTLLSLSALAATIGPLFAAPLTRLFKPYWVLWVVVLIALVLIAITPLLATFFAFAVILCLRSVFNGIHQPLVITLMLKTVDTRSQGKAMGLRATTNRVSSIVAPVLMGTVAEFIGIEAGFYVIGVLSVICMIIIAIWMTRHPEIHEKARDG